MRPRFRATNLYPALFALALSTGCVFGDPGPRGVGVVGVKESGGQLSIRVGTCRATSRITTVTLETSGKTSRVLWSIDSQSGAPAGIFVAGVAPAGFSEQVPLIGTLSPAESYVVSVDLQGEVLRPVVEFRPGNLDSNLWLADSGQTVSDAEFAKLGRCK